MDSVAPTTPEHHTMWAAPTAAPAAARGGRRTALLTYLSLCLVAGVHVCAAGTPASDAARFDAVKAWVVGRGGRVHPSVALVNDDADASSRGLAVAAAHTPGVARGEELAFISNAAAVQAGSEEEARTRGVTAIEDRAKLNLAVKFLEVWKTGRGGDYSAYLAMLPREYATGSAFTHGDIACLSVSAASMKQEYDAIRDAHVHALLDIAQTHPLLKNVDITEADAAYAFHTVSTRAVAVEDGAEGAATAPAPALYPVFDMLNHNQSGASVAVKHAEDGIYLYAADDVAPGEPLTINYGSHLTLNKLLVFHGFADASYRALRAYLQFPEDEPGFAALGCTAPGAVEVLRDGSVSDKLVECVLYSILPREDRAAYLDADAAGRAVVVAERRLDALQVYSQHLTQVLALYPSSLAAPCDTDTLGTTPVTAANDIARAGYLRAIDAIRTEVRASGRRRTVEVAGAKKAKVPERVPRREENDDGAGEDEDWDM